ncbi:Uncharacterised protein [Yersinia aldovae]|uniref:Uncharacterized protein n=1 Tax=Yersinia aldovae TaxID=29483 RepID=A0A0T9TIH8_YERAL|nr:Uncharacterised protein [Yersinia aldovae]CNK81130.1 Uncharacterised protein [Yersinia aldovae]CNK85220.1 Uncharacterised protein [Yersinia aldovae]
MDLSALNNDFLFTHNFDGIGTEHQLTTGTDRHGTARDQCRSAASGNLMSTTDREGVVTADVGQVGTAHVGGISQRHIQSMGRAHHDTTCRAYLYRGGQRDGLRRSTEHSRCRVSPNNDTAIGSHIQIRIRTNDLCFIIFRQTSHITLGLFPVLLQARFIFETHAVIVGQPTTNSTADHTTLRRISR